MSGTDDGFSTRTLTADLEALQALEAALRRSSPGGDVESIGRALACTGEVMRRCPPESAGAGATVDAVLQRLPAAGVTAWCETLDLSSVEARLRRAADEAVEGALPETWEDRPTWLSWAKEGLLERDRLASQHVALLRLVSLGGGVSRSHLTALEEQVRNFDGRMRSLVRAWVALNPWRRAERDLLLPEHRAAAWWFTDRAECDELLLILAGQSDGAAHLGTCALCRRDVAAVGDLSAPLARHLTEDDLWSLDLGRVPAHQKTVFERHARGCRPCRQAMAALEEGEDAIAEAINADPPRALPPTATIPRAPSGDVPEIVGEHAQFRVLLFRRPTRSRLVVEPRHSGGLAAARVSLPESPHRPLVARPGPAGFELELSEAFRIRGVARVQVKARAGGEDLELDVALVGK